MTAKHREIEANGITLHFVEVGEGSAVIFCHGFPAIWSAVETCRRLKIPVRDYLSSVLPGLGDFPVGRIAKLTPTAWANRN